MLYLTVLTSEVPVQGDIWPLIGQYPDLSQKFMAFMKPDTSKIAVDVRSSNAFADLKMRPYMFAVKLVEAGVEFDYDHLPIIVLYNKTQEQHDEEHTKQRLKFQMPDIWKALEFIMDAEYSELEQHITSTGNGLLVMRDIDRAELRDAFARGNRSNFTVVEGTKS
jgi:hypothetical protein